MIETRLFQNITFILDMISSIHLPSHRDVQILSNHDDRQDIELTCPLLSMSHSISQLYGQLVGNTVPIA